MTTATPSEAGVRTPSVTWLRFRRNRSGLVGAVMIGLFAVMGLLAPWLAPFDPDEIDLLNTLQGPSAEHPLGLDHLGRDMLSRLIYGARTSLVLGLAVVAGSGLVGAAIGVVAAYYGGRVDSLIMRAVDVFMAFPSILLALAVISALGPGLEKTVLAVGIATAPRFARVARGSTLKLRDVEYVQAARSLGVGDLRILTVHLLPNVVGPLIVQGTLLMGEAVLVTSGLGFLGLGVQPPLAEWGQMLAEGRGYLRVAPHVAIFPGMAIMLLVLGFNLLGDALRDALDVQLPR